MVLRSVWSLYLGLLSHHLILISLSGMHPFQSHGGEGAAEFVDADAAHGGRIGQAEGAVYLRGGQEETFGVGSGEGVDPVEDFFGRMETVEVGIVLLQGGFFLLVHPDAFTVGDEVLELGKELVVVHGAAVYGVGDFDAEKTAAAGGVVEQLELVAGTDEGGEALELDEIRGVRPADGDFLQLEEILERG